MATPFYLTTAIFYPTAAPPPLHSLFEVIASDALARYRRLLGDDVRFQTGTDEHSVQIERVAREQAVEPRGMVDGWVATWRSAFDRFGVSYDRFIRTTDPDHVAAATEMVRRARAAGDIYKGTYAGWYCPGDNEFKTDQQIVDGRCPDHPTLDLQWLEEENYFFALSTYQDRLEALYRDNPGFCEPEHFRNEVLGWLRDGLQDFSVSRSGSTWGIPFPGDAEHRIYVWFDALTNYLTGAGFPAKSALFERFWPADVHVIGKNITRFHCLYWPVMLISAGIELPRLVFAHGFMLMKGSKMSKTTGNVIDADEAVALMGIDGVRYAVLREIPFDRDGDITLEAMVRRYNADLANDLGNLVNRTLSMAGRYLEGLIAVPESGELADGELRAAAGESVFDYHAAMRELQFDQALAAINGLVRAANGYAESQAPWVLHRDGNAERLGQVLGNLGEACRILGHLVAPFMPSSASALHEQLGTPRPYDERCAGGPGLDALVEWGSGPTAWHAGTASPLFPRIEPPEAVRP
ncbi:MAG: class I tRNA ligase family protein [Candidatus Limnocylindria bacterium]